MAPVTPSFPNDRASTPVQPELTSIPTISPYKVRHVDPAKLAQRAERKRVAAYALKPRFEYAFGSWAPEVLKWNFEGEPSFNPPSSSCFLSLLFLTLHSMSFVWRQLTRRPIHSGCNQDHHYLPHQGIHINLPLIMRRPRARSPVSLRIETIPSRLDPSAQGVSRRRRDSGGCSRIPPGCHVHRQPPVTYHLRQTHR